MSSLKMTFSLTSLIFLIALGLVFVPTSVMAHDAIYSAGTTPAATDDIRPHQHPLAADIPAITGSTPATNDRPVVSAHGVHPVPIITLMEVTNMAKGDEIIVTNTTTGTTDVFTVNITFDMPVSGTDASQSEPAVPTLAAANFIVTVFDEDGTPLANEADSAAIAAGTAPANAGDPIPMVVTIGTNGFPGEDEMHTIKIRFVGGSTGVFGLQTSTTGPDGVSQVNIPGAAPNYSAIAEYKLVRAFAPAPTPEDNTAPVARITPPEMPASDGTLVFNIDLDEDVLPEGFGSLQASDFDVEGDTGTPGIAKGTAPDAGMEQIGGEDVKARYQLTVTPDTMGDTTVTVTLRDNSAWDMGENAVASVSATYDNTAPTVMITKPAAPDADDNLTFTFVFSEPIMGFESNDIRGSGFSIVASVPMKMASTDTMTMTETWTVKVTPESATTAVTVAINAGAVDDKNGNALAAGMTATYTPGAPAAPANFTAVEVEDTAGKVILSWTKVDGASYEYRKKISTADFMADASDYMVIEAADLVADPDDSTMVMYSVTGLTGGTAYTFEVRVKASGNVPAGTAASDTATPERPAAAAGDPVSLTVPAKSYVIVARTATGMGLPAFPPNTAEGSSPTKIMAWSTMPNLEDLFFQGGSLLLVTSKTKLDRDKKADTDPEEAKERDVLITEIMAARNTAKVGNMTEYLAHQWIELYNKLPVPVSVTLSQKSERPAPGPGSNEVRLDLVSNVVNPGWNFTGLGADGTDDGDPETADLSPFVSFYRNNRGEPGWQKSRWTTSTDTYYANHKGTPGAAERSGSIAVTATNPTYNVVINEIGNYNDDKYDWIELRNVNQGDGNIKKWQLWEITGDKKKSTILNMPDNDAHKIGAVGDVLLIVATDPYRDPNHPLAAGINITKDNGRVEKTGIKSRYYVAGTGFKLANSGKTLLLLRSRNDGGDHEGIVDLTGTHFIQDQSDAFATDVWPLKGQTKGNDNHGHGDVVKGADENLGEGHVYQRINAGRGTGKEVWERRGYTGVGYKRSARNTAQHGGTPGFDNGLIKDKDSVLAGDAAVTISEIMYDRGRKNNLPQWIELYNSSKTQAVNLNEWKLKIESADDVDVRNPAVTIGNLGGTIIQPNQTVLIVAYTTGRTSRGSQGAVDFPAQRIINLSGKGELEIPSDVNKRNYRLLSQTSFKITLIEKGGGMVDMAGNMGAATAWELPMVENGEGRSSVIRRYDEGMKRDGTMSSAWVLASESELSEVRVNETYYGSPDDVGTPGYRGGGALPVSLSKFRPERMKDTGEIVVRWVTESELNNAGFNILRSEKRDGEFTKVHFEAGEGTTSERTVYEWKDTTAKPNVVYYYQIQDVSLDGDVTTLRITHLRGNVTAAGKATTTWGEIKALH